LPRPTIRGSGLTLRYHDDAAAPPLLHIDRFSSSAGIWGLLAHRLHLRDVTLDGLDVRIPADGVDVPHGDTPHRGIRAPILIDTIEAHRARLEIPSHRKDRLPRIFDIENLRIDGFGLDRGARFRAQLVNPLPRGHIATNGTFGPWNTGVPEQTPVKGDYTFSHANLGDIKGIAGTLSSVGRYAGVLERLVVEGRTDTPDFRLDIAGAPVPLTTRFKAVVDGTNGDTWLESVDARLGQTSIAAKGEVVRAQAVKGRRIALDVRVAAGRIEDLMRLAVNTPKPPLLGRIDVVTTFLLPAGDAAVADRLQLEGTFTLARARFTNLDVERRITLLSLRGRGDDDGDGTGEHVVSNLHGRFKLRNGTLALSDLRFTVPGAEARLDGTYDLHSEAIDLAGDLLMDASLADMTHGVKSVLARLAQPLFRRKGGGSRLPIRISGTRSHPSFGLDVHRVFHRR
ncbi:MAG TPA: AsmA-like C-terminal region-containing protein, partial [Vicinamibacterales bacterium]|nr:AsmA-like C-terminal region-containing protein [Vicinamibacterales bacterium]